MTTLPQGDESPPGGTGGTMYSPGEFDVAESPHPLDYAPEWITDYVPTHPLTQNGSWWFAWGVFAAFSIAVWLTHWPLEGWAGDFGLYFIQPVIWLAVALLALYGWLRLPDAPAFKPTLIAITLGAAVLHVIVLLIAGGIGAFVDSPFIDGVIELPLNLFYVLTVLAAAETSRALLFTVWRRDNRALAFAGISFVFAVAALTATELTPFDDVDQLLEVAGQRWVPVLAISVLATALVEIGGLGPSFVYRLAVFGFMWLWPSLPDLHWVGAGIVGLAMPWVAWRLINGFYLRTDEGEEVLDAERRPGWGALKGIAGVTFAVVVIVAGMVLIFGTGLVGYRVQVIDDDSMAPDYERGDVVLIDDDINPASLEVDDVVRILDGDETPVRRIVSVHETRDGEPLFRVRADNLTTIELILPEELAGQVLFNVPEVGDLVLWWRD